jgi:hypothetical protein
MVAREAGSSLVLRGEDAGAGAVPCCLISGSTSMPSSNELNVLRSRSRELDRGRAATTVAVAAGDEECKKPSTCLKNHCLYQRCRLFTRLHNDRHCEGNSTEHEHTALTPNQHRWRTDRASEQTSRR